MEQIDWNKFGLQAESKDKSFEDLCMFLCCRELKISKIDSYHSQPGIETEPFEVNGKKYGFQAKFFESKFDWQQVKKSVNKGIELYPQLDKIFIYSNKEKTLNLKTGEKTEPETELEENSKEHNIDLEYITHKGILKKLSQPSNFDLAQLYFGIGNELGFIKSSTNPEILTLLQSSEYLDLPVINSQKEEINVTEEILLEEQNVFLVTGNPGAGKSIFIHKLLEVFGGLIAKDESEMIKILEKNKAVPILINLKNCINDSLENIVRNRKNDSKVNTNTLSFIYLFDGLDELDGKNADNALFQMYELSQKNNTNKIIISCRSGNLNRIKAKRYFKDLIEYQIKDLDELYLNKYFEKKSVKAKQDLLNQIMNINPNLIKEIKDILLIKLFWDTIEEIDESSSIIDVFDKKIDLLLDNPHHKKNLENLNLLNPKKEQIIKLNQDISFEFQKKFQFRFSQKELQDIILSKFDLLDYKSVNIILDYISDLFFENSYSPSLSSNTSYIYQHRRYQEYFFTQKLKEEYEKNPSIIRELRVLPNREYLETLFLPYLRKEYEKENNLPMVIEVNMIKNYLGKHKGFGVSDDYYMQSNEFIPALTAQETPVINEILENEHLQIKDKIFIDLEELKTQFQNWDKNERDSNASHYLIDIWSYGVSTLIKNIALFWKANQQEVAHELIAQLETVLDLYDKYRFRQSIRQRMQNPFFNQIKNWIYYRLVVRDETVKDVLENLIRKNYHITGSDMSGKPYKNRIIYSFYGVCLKEKRDEFYQLINELDEYELLLLLDIFTAKQFLPVFINSTSIHSFVKSFVNDFKDISGDTIYILFFKKYFGLKISAKEISVAEAELEKLANKRNIDWLMSGAYNNYALISYILDTHSFEKYLQNKSSYRYFGERGLYSALYKDFISLLKDEKKTPEIIRDYIRYINYYIKHIHTGHGLKKAMSVLWAHIFSIEDDTQLLSKSKKHLIMEDNYILPFVFYVELNNLNPNKFPKVTTSVDLLKFENELLNSQDEFNTYIDDCFELSKLFSKIDSKKGLSYFEKGVTDGILRHGFHKDYIVSIYLIEAFKIISNNHWVDEEQYALYAKAIFHIALRVTKITDGDETSGAADSVIYIVVEKNIKLAEQFKNKVLELNPNDWSNNDIITSILTVKARNGVAIETIEHEMREYELNYQTSHTISTYYKAKFRVYMEIAKSYLYTDEEQKKAFLETYRQVEMMEDQDAYNPSYGLENEIPYFQELCKKYRKKINLEIEKRDDNNASSFSKKKTISEKQFIKQVQGCTTVRQLKGKYQKLNNYNNDIILKTKNAWTILINKTLELNQNISLLFDYFDKYYFMRAGLYSGQAKYFHIAVSIALQNVKTKQETLDYLYRTSGHSGFLDTIKIYEAMEDKEMCLELFNRFVKFCKLIVD